MTHKSYIDDRVKSLGASLLPSVRPLAVFDDYGDELLPIGSCVLVWHSGSRYLLTAAHVAELYPDRSIHLGTASAWREIAHPFRLFKKRDAKGDDDTIDIAYKRLDSALADDLDGCHFLTGSQLGTSDRPHFQAPGRSKYTALGWPKNRLNYSRAFRETTPENIAHTGSIASLDEHKSIKVRADTSLAIEFNKKRVVGSQGVQQAPAITGLSGGGMFRMPSLELVGDLAQPTLAAIIIQHRPVERLMLGTRLGPILRGIDDDPQNALAIAT